MSIVLIIANIIGYIGLLALYGQVVFGSRHIFKYITTNTVRVNWWHTRVGKYAIFAIILHPLVTMMNRLEDLLWVVTPNFIVRSETHITFGRFALFLFLAVWVTSALVRQRIKWHPWKWIHLLAYPVVVLSFLHVESLGTFYREYPIIQFIWLFLALLLLVSIVVRFIYWSGLCKQKYTLIEKTRVGNDIMLIKLSPRDTPVTSVIGQHFFLQSGRFRSEHPFTIVRNEGGVLSFGIRRVAGFMNRLESMNIGDTMYVDGPYGVFTCEAQNIRPKIVISAGIGVTPFIDLVDKFGLNTIYINCNRTIEEAIERDFIKSKVLSYTDIVNTYAGAPDPSIKVGRLSEIYITQILGDGHRTNPVFVCGSPMFISAVKDMFVNLGTPKKNVFYEELGF